VIDWRGQATLDNAANDGLFPEHTLVTVPFDSRAIIDIRSAANDSSDRLVVTGSDASDRYLLTATGTDGNAIATIQALDIRIGQTALSNGLTITHQHVENVEINSLGGDDRLAVRTLHARTTFNTGAGNDAIFVGSNATLGGLGLPDTNAGGTLNAINALLTVNGQGSGDSDLLMLDDSGDGAPNQGTLTSDRITNGVIGTPAPLMAAGALMGVGGSITYRTLEILEIELGNAANSNVFTVESTHGDGSITAISSGTGADVFNIETMAGNLTLSTGGGSDTVRVGTTTGDIGQQAGVLDAFDSSANAIVGRLEIDAGTGNADALKLYDSGDTTRENGRLSSAEIVGMGMTLGIGYTGFDVLKVWLSNNDNGYYIDSTHTGVTFIDLGDEQPVVNGVNDVVNVRSISGPTTIDAGQGNDVIRVNFDDKGSRPSSAASTAS
jgi:hypothetical protein